MPSTIFLAAVSPPAIALFNIPWTGSFGYLSKMCKVLGRHFFSSHADPKAAITSLSVCEDDAEALAYSIIEVKSRELNFFDLATELIASTTPRPFVKPSITTREKNSVASIP